jgi:hypothetical protein
MPRFLRFAVALCVVALSGPVTVPASAVAISVGPQRPVPIVLDRSQFDGSCDVPDLAVGSRCAVWFSTTVDTGDLNWAFVNVTKWNVTRSATCPTSGPSNRGEYIRNGYPLPLQVDDAELTYVCADNDTPPLNFSDLVALQKSHEVRPSPVSDCTEQLDAGGSVVPCGGGPPNKRAVVGFAPFRVGRVLKGNDPKAIGTPGGPRGFCGRRTADPDAICLVLRFARFGHQPDGAIRDGSSTDPFVGDNIDERSGTTQVVSSLVPAGDTATLWLRVQNDGRVLERLAVGAHRTFDGWRIRFSFDGDDVTAAIRTARYRTPLMAPDA